MSRVTANWSRFEETATPRSNWTAGKSNQRQQGVCTNAKEGDKLHEQFMSSRDRINAILEAEIAAKKAK